METPNRKETESKYYTCQDGSTVIAQSDSWFNLYCYSKYPDTFRSLRGAKREAKKTFPNIRLKWAEDYGLGLKILAELVRE